MEIKTFRDFMEMPIGKGVTTEDAELRACCMIDRKCDPSCMAFHIFDLTQEKIVELVLNGHDETQEDEYYGEMARELMDLDESWDITNIGMAYEEIEQLDDEKCAVYTVAFKKTSPRMVCLKAYDKYHKSQSDSGYQFIVE
jgi:hypothetical protein